MKKMVCLEGVRGQLWLVIVVTLCLCATVDSNQEQGNNYRDLVNYVRSLLSNSYRDTTAVMSGSRAISYVSLDRLVRGTQVELILSHRDLYVLGYRVRQNNQRVVYLFSDADRNALDQNDYDGEPQILRFGGSYTELERFAGHPRQGVRVTAYRLEEGITHLQNSNLQALNQQLAAETLLSLVMIVSEAARFREISDAVERALRGGDTWYASNRDTGLMNSWHDISTFIVRHSQDPTTSATQWFPAINENLSVRAALLLMAVIARCFQTSSRTRRQTGNEQCAMSAGVDAALADGDNSVYLFNGPNFAQISFTPGTTDDRIVGGIKSIYQDWSFLRGTPFVTGLDAGFRVPYSSNAYIFKGGDYALIDVPGRRIINGPKTIWSSWPSLRPTLFVNGIDAAFASIRQDEVYLFRASSYALVNFAPGTTDDWIVNGPKFIDGSWPSLRNTDFIYGFDASFARPDKSEAYLFKADKYVLIDYAPGTTNDHIIGRIQKIRDGWPSLRKTVFDV